MPLSAYIRHQFQVKGRAGMVSHDMQSDITAQHQQKGSPAPADKKETRGRGPTSYAASNSTLQPSVLLTPL